MAEKPPIDFVSRARALKEAREGKEKNPEEEVSQNVIPQGRENVVAPVFGAKLERLPTPLSPTPPRHESPLDPTPTTPGEFTMRMFSRLDPRFGTDVSLFSGLAGSDPEAQRKFTHLAEMDSALSTLRGQMSEAKERANVAMRRSFMREAGTNDLADQFWSSNEHDWSARPSTYIALLDELEERGFFNLSMGEDPEPEPPAPRTWNDEPNTDPDGNKPQSPGRPHRGRPRR